MTDALEVIILDELDPSVIDSISQTSLVEELESFLADPLDLTKLL